MSADVMDRICGGHRFLGAAELAGYRLAFTRRSIRTASGVADIVPAAGFSVWGALYEVDGRRLAAIDEKEGNGWAYLRRRLRVRLRGDTDELDAHAYAVIAPEQAEIRPAPTYLQGLLEAANERGLPEDYTADLATHCADLAP